MQFRFLKYIFVSIVFLFALDHLFYNYLIFVPDNHSGWDSFRWYNFEYNNRKLQEWKNKNPAKKLILVAGSSISKYSIQSRFIQDILHARGHKDVEVRNFMHAAMTPADLFFYKKRMARLKPYLIVYPTNPADLDLERYSAPWQSAIDYEDELAFRFISIRHPAQLLYPGPFADEFGLQNGLDEYLQRRLYSVFASLRLREQWWDPFVYNKNAKNGFVKSYLNYQGIRIQEGLWKEGRSVSCLSFPSRVLQHEKGKKFHFEAPPSLVGNDFNVSFYEMVEDRKKSQLGYFWDSNTKAHFQHDSDWKEIRDQFMQKKIPNCQAKLGKKIFEMNTNKAGWYKVDILPHVQKSSRVMVRLSHVELVDGKRSRVRLKTIGRGIRLPAYFGRDRNHLSNDDIFIRRPDWNSRRLYLMSDKHARLDFYKKNEPDNWRHNPALHQLNFLRLGKYYTNWYRFEPKKMIQARFLQRLVKYWNDKSHFLLINNPENPATLDVYEKQENGIQKSKWYLGYQNYLKNICDLSKCTHVDVHQELTEKYFLDSHHLTFEGMLKMAPLYADMIEKALLKGR